MFVGLNPFGEKSRFEKPGGVIEMQSLSIKATPAQSAQQINPRTIAIVREYKLGNGVQLGEPGATGKVVKVTFEGENYAIKIVRNKMDKVRREGRFHKRLSEKPNTARYVTQFVDYVEKENEAYLITKYENTVSLIDVLIDISKRRRAPFSQALSNELIRNLRNALKAFHDEGFLHNDIKADNILVKLDESGQLNGEIVIIDFDTVCRSFVERPCPDKNIKGTLSYWPDFVQADMSLRLPYDEATNDYSLGVVLNYILKYTESPSENAKLNTKKFMQPGLNEYRTRQTEKRRLNVMSELREKMPVAEGGKRKSKQRSIKSRKSRRTNQ